MSSTPATSPGCWRRCCTDPSVALVKGFYDRPLHAQGSPARTGGGGRVTELVARPLIALHWPALSGVVQPLAGEYAAAATCSSSCRSLRGTGSSSPCSSTRCGPPGWRQWPRSTSAAACTETRTTRRSGAWRRRCSSPRCRGWGDLSGRQPRADPVRADVEGGRRARHLNRGCGRAATHGDRARVRDPQAAAS